MILGATIWLVVCVVGPKWLRHALCGLCIVAMFALSYHYGVLVRSGCWIGDVFLHPLAVECVNQGDLKGVGLLAEEKYHDDQTVYPAGWLEDIAPSLQKELMRRTFHRLEIKTAWHSWYTRLFPFRDIPLGVWFRGGKLANAPDLLELRERAEPREGGQGKNTPE
jgi:hypothetical protein